MRGKHKKRGKKWSIHAPLNISALWDKFIVYNPWASGDLFGLWYTMQIYLYMTKKQEYFIAWCFITPWVSRLTLSRSNQDETLSDTPNPGLEKLSMHWNCCMCSLLYLFPLGKSSQSLSSSQSSEPRSLPQSLPLETLRDSCGILTGIPPVQPAHTHTHT